MNINDARTMYVDGAAVARSVLERARVHHAEYGWWWPAAQREASVVSHAMALEWAKNIDPSERPGWVCMNVGRAKDRMLETEKTRLIEASKIEDAGIRPTTGEVMLDLVVLPELKFVESGLAEHAACLTMESEMSARQGVNRQIGRNTNDYAWDFFKLVWVPSPRRLFVARVGKARGGAERARIEALKNFLDEIIVWYRRSFAPADKLVMVILGAATPENSFIKVVIGSDASSRWESLFPPANP